MAQRKNPSTLGKFIIILEAVTTVLVIVDMVQKKVQK